MMQHYATLQNYCYQTFSIVRETYIQVSTVFTPDFTIRKVKTQGELLIVVYACSKITNQLLTSLNMPLRIKHLKN